MRRKFRKLNGILLLDKPLGLSSNKALQDARFLFSAEKAGHTGSLDPLATGMLPVCFGEATKVSAFLLDSDKRYLTTARLGMVSTTGDAEGDKIVICAEPKVSREAVERVLPQFRGDILQVPPMYSALKKDGQPLYKLARQGVEIERPARPVTIHELDLLEQRDHTLTLDVRCSKGTYIRTLVEDMGDALACGAYVSMLRRTDVEPFNGMRMYTPDELKALAAQGQDALDAVLLPVDAALTALPALELEAAQIARLQQGQKVNLTQETPNTILRLYSEAGVFVGMGEVHNAVLSAKRMMAYNV